MYIDSHVNGQIHYATIRLTRVREHVLEMASESCHETATNSQITHVPCVRHRCLCVFRGACLRHALTIAFAMTRQTTIVVFVTCSAPFLKHDRRYTTFTTTHAEDQGVGAPVAIVYGAPRKSFILQHTHIYRVWLKRLPPQISERLPSYGILTASPTPWRFGNYGVEARS